MADSVGRIRSDTAGYRGRRRCCLMSVSTQSAATRAASTSERLAELRARLDRLERGEPSTPVDVERARAQAISQARAVSAARDRLVTMHRSSVERHLRSPRDWPPGARPRARLVIVRRRGGATRRSSATARWSYPCRSRCHRQLTRMTRCSAWPPRTRAGHPQRGQQRGQHPRVAALPRPEQDHQRAAVAVAQLVDLGRQAPAGAPQSVVRRLRAQILVVR